MSGGIATNAPYIDITVAAAAPRIATPNFADLDFADRDVDKKHIQDTKHTKSTEPRNAVASKNMMMLPDAIYPSRQATLEKQARHLKLDTYRLCNSLRPTSATPAKIVTIARATCSVADR
jgi:hypothetical protein